MNRILTYAIERFPLNTKDDFAKLLNMDKNLNKSVYLEGARIFIKNMNFGVPMEFDIHHDSPFIKLHFVFNGNFHFEPSSDRGIPVTVGEGQYNFFYMPEVQGKLTVDQSVVSSVDIECEESFFNRLFKNDLFKISSTFGEAIKAGFPFKMFEESQEIDSFLQEKVNEIVRNSQQREVNIIYIETQLMAIFRYLFSYLCKGNSLKEPRILKNEDHERVIQAEKVLRKHLKNTITVDELAATIGTNRHKLNRDFKKIFNEPIFSYLTHLRMAEAKVMLIKKRMNVSEVADSVGYKNSQHFTTAFKRHFGYIPSKLIHKN